MNDESIWRRRAAKHAALADPARSHIAQLLTGSDRSPTELQQALGIQSNLVAHHLHVMEDAGLITRHRSEADRRRSYVTLAEEAFADLLPSVGPVPRRVVFVCTANSARSQMAAAIWPRFSAIPVISAGTHPAEAIERAAIDAARDHGYPIVDTAPRALQAVLHEDDFVVTVCDTAREELATDADAHWSIPDPVRDGTPAAFENAFDSIVRRITDLAPRFTAA